MSRSRVLAFASLGIVALGAAAAVGALVTSSARPGAGPLPPAGFVLPADATFLAGIDVKRLTASALYRKQAAARPAIFTELEERTGLHLERDVDLVVLAGSKTKRTLAFVSGSFDTSKLASKAAPGLVFLDKGTLLLGDPAQVRETALARAQGRTPLQSNAPMLERLARVKPGSTFWMVGDESLVASLPASLPAPGGSGARLTLPALRGLVATGDVEPLVSIQVTGDTDDAAAARNLADMLRGVAAIFTMQAGQKPELKELAAALSITQNENRVLVNFRVAPEVLERLASRPASGGAAPAQP